MNDASSAPRTFAVGLVEDTADLHGILALQRENLKSALEPAEIAAQGFVTVVHTLDVLQRMHELAPSVVAKAGGNVVGYALTMPVDARALVPLLEPMFERLADVSWRGLPLLERRFYVMGQICIARAFRSTGLFGALYAEHDARYGDRFDCIVTEVAEENSRSLRAHAKAGFEPLVRYAHGSDSWVVLGRALTK